MAEFKQVFSTTLKVWVSLLIISAVIGVGYLIVAGIASVPRTTEHVSEPEGSSTGPLVTMRSKPGTSYQSPVENAADAYRTTMPKSTWDKLVDWAVAKHCLFNGMNQDEVLRAVGEPTTKKSSNWGWRLSDGPCIKYDGENCVEHQHKETTVLFTDKGSVYLYEDTGCRTLDGKWLRDIHKVDNPSKPKRKLTEADLRERVLPYVHECGSYWCWGTNAGFQGSGFKTKEDAIADAVARARDGLTF